MIEDFEMSEGKEQRPNYRRFWIGLWARLWNRLSAPPWTRVTFSLLFYLFVGFRGISWAEFGLQNVRVARADVDGNGTYELIAGGRIGWAQAADIPAANRSAGVGVYRVEKGLLQPLCERRDLHVVADVAGGDVDGDGIDEVVVAGMGLLTVFEVVNHQLVEIARASLPGDWTDRVMVGDVDGDGQVEVGVTSYSIDSGAEVGRSKVTFFQWANGTLEKRFQFDVSGHIGDLSAMETDDGQGLLALEVGMGDEGGEVRVLSGQNGQVVWAGEMTTGRVRALSLDSHGTKLVIGGVDGRVWTATLGPTGLSAPGMVHRAIGITGLAWMPNQLLTFSNRLGLQMLGF
jgi:hypothetical protein